MSVTTLTSTPIVKSIQIPEKTLVAGLALTSFSALLLELALTRLFSVVLWKAGRFEQRWGSLLERS